MTSALVIVRICLTAMLGLAGMAKVADRHGSTEAVARFGVPDPLVGATAWALPLIEVVIAAGLIGRSTARWSAIATALLLTLFSVGIAAALARGERVDCHCFGRLSQKPAGRATLVRNATFVAMAGFVALAPEAPGPSLGRWVSGLSDAERVGFWLGLVTAAVAVGSLWFVREILRQHGRMLLRIDALESSAVSGSGDSSGAGLALGTAAPSFAIPAWTGGELALDGLLAEGRPVLLVFSDPHCGPCAAAVPVVASAQREAGDRLTLAVLSNGATAQTTANWREHRLARVGVASGPSVAARYGINGSPAAVLISREGLIDSPAALGLVQVSALVREAAGLPSETVGTRDRPAAEFRRKEGLHVHMG